MNILNLRVGDRLSHAPTGQCGRVVAEPMKHEGVDMYTVALNTGGFHVNQTGFDLWWDAYREREEIHRHEGCVTTLQREGRVIRRVA